MRVNKRRILVMIASAGLVLLAGEAAMAANTIPSSVGGYGNATVSGATAQSISYTLSADGATITGATIVFVGNLTGKAVSAGFNSAALVGCAVGSYNAGSSTTAAQCTGLAQSTAGAASLAVAVYQ